MVDIRCPKCGSRTRIRTRKEDNRPYYVCINYPDCKGRVPAEENRGDERGRESAKTAVRRSGKAQRESDAGVKRPERRVPGPVEERWGDDWDEEIEAPDGARRRVAPKPAATPEKKEPPRPRPKMAARKEEHPDPQGQRSPEAASYRPQYKKAPRPAPVPPQETERQEPAPYRPQYQKPPRWEVEAEEPPELQGRGESEHKSYRPQYRRGPKPVPVPSQESARPQATPYRPQYPRAQRRGTSSEEKKPSKPWRHKTPEAAYEEPRPQKSSKASFAPLYKRGPKSYVAPERQEPIGPQRPRPSKDATYLPLYKKTPKKYVPPEDREFAEPQQQMAPGADAAIEVKSSPRLRYQRVPQEYLAPPPGKKRSMPVIVIALIIAFLAIDGMIYAAFVMRNQDTSTSPTPTPTNTPATMSSQQDDAGLSIDL